MCSLGTGCPLTSALGLALLNTGGFFVTFLLPQHPLALCFHLLLDVVSKSGPQASVAEATLLPSCVRQKLLRQTCPLCFLEVLWRPVCHLRMCTGLEASKEGVWTEQRPEPRLGRRSPGQWLLGRRYLVFLRQGLSGLSCLHFM